MEKLSKQNESVRKLTSRYLVVDWNGTKTLFYYMTRKQFQDGLKTGIVNVTYQLNQERKEIASFHINYHKGEAMAIGCEYFNREDVRKIKRWAREGRK